MACKLVITLICISVLKGLNGQVSPTCGLKISQFRLELVTITRNAGNDVSFAASAIRRDIAAQRINIRNAVTNLLIKASSTVKPNVELCKNTLKEDLASVSDQSLNICYNSAGINDLNQRVNQINNLKGSVNLICKICGVDTACVDAQIDSTRQQAEDLQQGISSDASTLQDKSAQCSQNAANGQLEIINNASNNFDTCIQSV